MSGTQESANAAVAKNGTFTLQKEPTFQPESRVENERVDGILEGIVKGNLQPGSGQLPAYRQPGSHTGCAFVTTRIVTTMTAATFTTSVAMQVRDSVPQNSRNNGAPLFQGNVSLLLVPRLDVVL